MLHIRDKERYCPGRYIVRYKYRGYTSYLDHALRLGRVGDLVDPGEVAGPYAEEIILKIKF